MKRSLWIPLACLALGTMARAQTMAPVTPTPSELEESAAPPQPGVLDIGIFDTYQTYPPYDESRMTGSSTTDRFELQRPDLDESRRMQVPATLSPNLNSVTTTTVPNR